MQKAEVDKVQIGRRSIHGACEALAVRVGEKRVAALGVASLDGRPDQDRQEEFAAQGKLS